MKARKKEGALTPAAAADAHVGPHGDQYDDVEGDDYAEDQEQGPLGQDEVPERDLATLVGDQVLQFENRRCHLGQACSAIEALT